MEEARLDRERFKREVKEFNKDNPDAAIPSKKSKSKTIGDLPQSKDQKKSINAADKTSGSAKEESDGPKVMNFNSELPIFTDVFLEHNKILETELKMLRKNNMESENAVLMKHVENMTNGVQKVEGEITAGKQKNLQLEIYLTRLKCVLASGLNSVSLESFKNGATIENIGKKLSNFISIVSPHFYFLDKFLAELCSPAIAASSPALIIQAAEAIRKIDLKINS